MIETTTREFTRRFAEFRAKAAMGESIRITSPDGSFVFMKESRGIRAVDLLERIGKSGIFDEGGAERIESARAAVKPARSPWD